MSEDAIDVVVTWVDGQDPHRSEKLSQYLSAFKDVPTSAAPTRFNECGEIRYCVFSILKYMPWVRKIFIVTDDQVPSVYKELLETPFAQKLEMVSHRTIFKGHESALPTFNSISIESMLWRIPNLAEQFIYFNDDCFVTKPLDRQAFFSKGAPLIRGHWRTQMAKKWQNRLGFLLRTPNGSKPKDPYRHLLEKSARSAGHQTRYLEFAHAPFALLKSIFEACYARHPEWIETNIQYRLRDEKQFWPIATSQYKLLKEGKGKLDKTLKSVIVNGDLHSSESIKESDENNQNTAFLCMQSLDASPKQTQAYLLDWLDRHITL